MCVSPLGSHIYKNLLQNFHELYLCAQGPFHLGEEQHRGYYQASTH